MKYLWYAYRLSVAGATQNTCLQAESDLATIVSHMAEHDQLLEKIGKLIEPLRAQLYEQGAAIQTLKTDVKNVDRKLETLDGKVAAVHEFNKKAHAETMKILLDTGEINYHELKKEVNALKKRVEELETHERVSHPHEN